MTLLVEGVIETPLQTFAGGVGFPAGAADVTAAMAGTATRGEGSWEGRFHGTDGAAGADARPSHATGRFDVHFPGAHIAGAFGAGR